MSSTEGKPITCKAAIAWKPNEPLSYEDVTVDPPKAGEIRLKVLYNALCHTDVYTWSGDDPEGNFPCILGHEGGAIVESVGEGVTEFKPGDHVIPLYTPECKKCKMCLSGKTNLCSSIRETQGKGVMPDGTSRFTARGQKLYHFMGTSTFSQYTVVSQYSAVVVEPDVDLSKVCLLGCGVTTGYGAAVKTANIQKGEKVAIFGLGCVGLAVIQGARARDAAEIWALDLNDGKQKWAKEFGATRFENPSKMQDGQVAQTLVKESDGGFDHTFDCTGNVNVMRQALECCHKGWGVSTIIGVAASGKEISTRPFQLVTGRKWQGAAFGGIKGKTDMPGLINDYKAGKLKVDEYITHHAKLSNVMEAFDNLKKGDCIRCVVDMSA